MSDAALIRLCRATVGGGALLAVAGTVVAVDTGQLGFWWHSFAIIGLTVSLAFGAFAWLAIRSQPRNAAVWSMAASVGLAIHSAGLGLAGALQGDGPGILDGGWHLARALPEVSWILVVAQGCSIPGLFIPLVYGLLLFPEGRLQSRRASGLAAISAPLFVIGGVTYGWSFRPGNPSPEGPLLLGSVFGLVLCAVLAAIDLLLRFRASSGVTRLQYKWVAWGTSLTVLVFGGITVLPDAVATTELAIVAAVLGALCWVVAYGMALVRYRIYDIDLVISRTLVYVGLVAAVSLTYIVAVAGLGTRIGGSDLWLSVAATALIAIVFEPTRAWLQRLADRLVYGRSATPHEVLADLTARMTLAESPQALLVRLANGLRAGTGARRTAVWLLEEGRIEPIAISGASGTGPDAGAAGPDPDADAANPGAVSLQAVSSVDRLPGTVVSIAHEGEVLAYLTLEEPPGMALQAADRRLAEDLAAAAALVVHRIRLETALRATADELAESRLRLAQAEDIELGHLGAELEGSVGPLVEALPAQLDRASAMAGNEGSERVRELLGTIAREAVAATDQIRALAHGIHPQVLSSQGLPAAVRSLVTGSALQVELELDLQRRHGRVVESAVYFCLAEALTNVAKHARGPVTVHVGDGTGELVFTVTDAGPGFDPADVVRGTGLHNLSDRVDMLGGAVSISSRPGGSTTVRGAIPLGSTAALGGAPAS